MLKSKIGPLVQKLSRFCTLLGQKRGPNWSKAQRSFAKSAARFCQKRSAVLPKAQRAFEPKSAVQTGQKRSALLTKALTKRAKFSHPHSMASQPLLLHSSFAKKQHQRDTLPRKAAGRCEAGHVLQSCSFSFLLLLLGPQDLTMDFCSYTSGVFPWPSAPGISGSRDS